MSISDEFDSVLQWGGSLVQHCRCGRTHFATNDEGADFDPGELEQLRADAKKEPTAYLEDPTNDSIGVAWFNGENHVWNCPCKSLERIENLLWQNREAFTRYYRIRAEREMRSLNATLSNIEPTP